MNNMVDDASKTFTLRSRILKTTDKKGVIPKNPDGTYTVCVGALDQVSVQDGLFYSAFNAEKFFNTQPRFKDALDKNYLSGECGHPVREMGMTDEQWLGRNMVTLEVQKSHDIHAVHMVPNYKDPETGENVVALMADILPTGPYGPALEKDLNTPGAQVAFSIRALTVPKYVNGRPARVLSRVITFDWVYRPGMPSAHKLNSLTCQSAFNPKDADKYHGGIDINLHAVEKLYRAQGNSNSSLSLQSEYGKGVIDDLYKELQGKKSNSSGAYNW